MTNRKRTKRTKPATEGAGVDFDGLDAFAPASPPERLPGEQRVLGSDEPEPDTAKKARRGRRRSVHPLARSIARTDPRRSRRRLNCTAGAREAMPDAGNRETRVSMSEVVERLIVEHLERVKGKR